MATEKRKIHRVIDAAGTLVQVLPETSAEQVTLADAAGNFTSNNVEGALAEVAEIAKTGGVTGVKGDAESAYRKGNVNITKANIGLGNVDNTADKDKTVKEAGKATNDGAGNNIVDTYATKQALQDATAGKAKTFTYDDYQKFVSATDTLEKTAMGVGDNVYIKTLGVPDMWVTRVNAVSTLYTYTSDQAIVDALDTTVGLTVGYFTFSKLETEKVDLDAYQTKTDSGLNTTSKEVVGAINEVKETADSALTIANANATEISKIKNGTDGTKVKNAEHADNADIADNAASADQLNRALHFGYYSKSTSRSEESFDGATEKSLMFEDDSFSRTSVAGTSILPAEYRIALKNTGVTAGQYSAVNVDAKGRVTAGGKSIEWGTSGQTTPSGDLMVGGLFMELQS